MNLNQVTYVVYAFEKSAHPGLTVDEVAKDFIHKAAYDSNDDKVKKFMNMILENMNYLGMTYAIFC